MAHNEHFELVEALEPTVAQLLAEHRERRKAWYFHGSSFLGGRPQLREGALGGVPGDDQRAGRTSLVLNLLTEDNLPYYHLVLERHLPEGRCGRWNNLWTAEEASTPSPSGRTC